jgi:hypothetical protein
MRLQLSCGSSEGPGRSQSCYDAGRKRDRNRQDEQIATRRRATQCQASSSSNAGATILVVLWTTVPQALERSLTLRPTQTPSKVTKLQVPADLQMLRR